MEKQIQLSLFREKENKKQEKIDKTIDELKKKYGYEIITRAGDMKVKNMLNIRKRWIIKYITFMDKPEYNIV